jgi:pimeloyl-ACP methyl ester carboxylesterase
MVSEHAFSIPGRTIRYLEAGSGSTLLLLHAFPLSSEMWRPQLEHVPDGWRFVAPDLKGFGAGARGAATSLDDMAEEVQRLLDGLGVARAVICGLSMGGYLTLTLYRRAPGLFRGLILANTRATADTPEGRTAREKMAALVRSEGPAAVASQMLPKLLGESSHASRPDLPVLLRRLIEANPADGLEGAIHAMKARPDSSDLLRHVQLPALVIAGEEDVLIPPAEAEAMHRLLPQSTCVLIRRAGHLSNLEAPGAFSAALQTFLEGIRQESGGVPR